MLTLEKLLRIYEMPPGRGGQSGNRGGGKSGGSSGSSSRGGSVSGATRGNIGAKTGKSGKSGTTSRGGAYDAKTSRAQNRQAPSRSSVSGATRGNISAKTAAPGSLAARQAAVDAANAKRAANPTKTTGTSIDLKSRDAAPSAGIDEGQFNTGSHSPTIGAAPPAPSPFRDRGESASGNFISSGLAKVGQGFRQMAIDTFGAEPGVEGYDSQGNYGYGWNSSYGQELRAGNPNVRAKGEVSAEGQQRMADNYNTYGTASTGGIDENGQIRESGGIFDKFGIDTTGFFDNIGEKIGGFVLGRVGMALGGTFGPVGAILGGVLGNYVGKQMVGGDEEGDDGKSSGIFGGLFSEGGLFYGTGYQASARDLGRGGAGESKPDDDKGIFANYAVGNTGGDTTTDDDKIIVPDGDDSEPDLTLEEYLNSLETDRAEAFANVRLQQRQALALQRISSRRYALGTSYRV